MKKFLPLVFLLLLGSFHAKSNDLVPAPGLVADFTTADEITTICAGDAIKFIDLTTENPIDWTWTFEGGTPATSALQNPNIQYNTPGVYKVLLLAHNGVQGDEEVKEEYIKVIAIPTATFTVSGQSCFNGNSFNFTNTGFTGTHLWTFNSGSPASSTATNPSGITFTTPGSHIVTHKVTKNGCQGSFSSNVVVFPAITSVNAAPTASNCAGATGTITVSGVTGGTSPFKYQLDGGTFQDPTVFSNVAPGPHTLVIKDAHNCTHTVIVTVPSSGGPTQVVTTITNGTCAVPTGSVTLGTVTGGATPYQYAMDNGTFSDAVVYGPLTIGSHTAKVKDANGCVLSKPVPVSMTAGPQSFGTSKTPTGCESPSGTITVTNTIGGVSPFTYAINTGTFSTNNTFTALPAGVHQVFLKDANGCTISQQITITTAPGPTAVATTTEPTTCQASTGYIVVGAVTGGTSPFLYSLNSGAFWTDQIFGGLGVGSYQVNVRDANGCIFSKQVAITQTPPPTGVAVTVQPTSCQASTGSITLGTVTSGTSPFTFSMDGSPFTNTVNYTGLNAGPHLIMVMDASGCSFSTSATITGTQPSDVAIAATSSSCSASTGTITIGSVTGGQSPFTYAINSGIFTNITSYSNLGAGTHSVSVKDANGCVLTKFVTIASSGPADFAATVTNTPCAASNGAIVIGTITGGNSPFTYSINGSAFTTTVSYPNLAAGGYTVAVKDASNCTFTKVVAVNTTSGPTALNTATTPETCGTNNGTISIGTVTGGQSPFTYSVNNSAFSSATSYPNLNTGSYPVTVKDASSCIFTVVATVSNLDGPTDFGTSSTQATCGNPNGTITIGAVSGGTAPYTYSINGGTFNSSTSFTGLAGGSHTLTVKDANQCTFTKSVSVPNPALPTFTVTTKPAGCFSATSGSLSFSALNGTPPFTMSIDGSAFAFAFGFNNLAAGNHTVVVKDGNGCTTSTVVVIGTVPPVYSSLTVTRTNPTCGQSDGVLNVTFNGGTAPFSVALNSQAPVITTTNSISFSGLAAGGYGVSVTDANGCYKSTAIIPALSSTGGPSALSFTSVSSTCNQANGSITITGVTGGTSPYQYAVNGGTFSTNTTYNNLPGNTGFPIVIKDDNGCTFNTGGAVSNIGFTPSTPTISQSGFLLSSNFATGNQWFRDGVAIAGQTGQTHLVQVNGTYTVVVTSGNCSSAPSAPVSITNKAAQQTGTGVETTLVEIDALNDGTENKTEPSTAKAGMEDNPHILAIYPNPTDGNFTITFQALEETAYILEVFNALGQVVFQDAQGNFTGEYRKELELPAESNGIYYVVLTNDMNRTVQKLIVH
jgi:large repetitive protein